MKIPRFWISLWIMKMPGFWLYQGSQYVRVTQGFEYVWIISNVPDYACICQTMWEYAKIYLNGFCFTFPYFCLLSTRTYGYLFQCLYETRSYSLKEHKTVFCFLLTGSISFCFKLNIFTRFQICLLPFWAKGARARGCESWYTTDKVNLIIVKNISGTIIKF